MLTARFLRHDEQGRLADWVNHDELKRLDQLHFVVEDDYRVSRASAAVAVVPMPVAKVRLALHRRERRPKVIDAVVSVSWLDPNGSNDLNGVLASVEPYTQRLGVARLMLEMGRAPLPFVPHGFRLLSVGVSGRGSSYTLVKDLIS